MLVAAGAVLSNDIYGNERLFSRITETKSATISKILHCSVRPSFKLSLMLCIVAVILAGLSFLFS